MYADGLDSALALSKSLLQVVKGSCTALLGMLYNAMYSLVAPARAHLLCSQHASKKASWEYSAHEKHLAGASSPLQKLFHRLML